MVRTQKVTPPKIHSHQALLVYNILIQLVQWTLAQWLVHVTCCRESMIQTQKVAPPKNPSHYDLLVYNILIQFVPQGRVVWLVHVTYCREPCSNSESNSQETTFSLKLYRCVVRYF